MVASSRSNGPSEGETERPGTGVRPVETPVLLEPPEPDAVAPARIPSPDEASEETPSPARNALLLWIEERRELLGWVGATIITVSVAVWIYWLQLAYPIAPGSDPGSWISISFAYIGKSYPGQVDPYGYPPLLFPILGAIVLITGSPLATGHIIIPVLLAFLGLSTYALSRAILRSVLLSLAFLSILFLDPTFMTLFFWGALPNLLAFSFMNLALVGLIWTGAGRLTWGTAFFWGFGAATVLTHSLAGLTLGAIVAVMIVLAMLVPLNLPKTGSPRSLGDAPGLVVRRLLTSRPGFIGLLVFVALVGGWYAATYATGTPHPAYFTPGSAVHPATYGSFLRNLLPGLVLGKLTMFYLLIFLVTIIFVLFGGLVAFRRTWISTGLLVLFGSWVAVPSLAIIGWILSISTDYHRFGFFLVIPAGLTIALLIDRFWLALGRKGDGRIVVSPPVADPALRPFPPTLRATPRARTAFVGVVAVVLILVLAGLAAPTYARYVTANAGTTHDQMFLDALNAIDHSGIRGSILTIKGDLKWTWAITDRQTYAPRPGNAFLYYKAQITDAALAYYALTSSFAVTNALVSASITGTSTTTLDYSVAQNGGDASILRIPPQLVQVTLNGTNGTVFTAGLNNESPTFQAVAGPGLYGVETYTEPFFIFKQSISAVPGAPTAEITSTVSATGGNRLVSFREVATGPALLSVATLQTSNNTFQWRTSAGPYTGPLTYGNVTPGALEEVTSSYYTPQLPWSTGSGAAVLGFHTSNNSSVTSFTCTLNLTTPSAQSTVPNLPPLVNTSQVWQQLGPHGGIRFILLPNQIAYSLYPGSYLWNEEAYLEEEFGCTVYYSNSEWVVLLVPPSL